MLSKTTVRNSNFLFKKLSLFIVLPVLFSIASCDKKTDPRLDSKFDFNKQMFVSQIRNSFESIDSMNILRKSLSENYDTLKLIYKERNFEPFFIKSFDSEFILDSVLLILGKAKEHGLNPEEYHLSVFDNLKEYTFNPSFSLTNEKRHGDLAHIEILLVDAILKFSEHMRHGRVNPRELYFDSYFLPVTDSINQKYFEPLNQQNIIGYLRDIQPKSDKYLKLQTALKNYNSLLDKDWIKIALTDSKIKVGDNYSAIDKVVHRLIQLGFMDSSKVKFNSATVYDSSLSTYIKEFQKVNGLTSDGIINKLTLERLNISPQEYVEKIKLNLERFRWINYSDTSKYILVNIPDFKLYAVENGNELFDIKICTGRKSTWETPNLYGQISYFVLNPTWSVPRSIIEEEIVNGLRKDSSYLKKRNFIAYKSGKQVSLDGLTAQELTKNRYNLVQNPGAGNALGKIKFMFNNPFGVYLHDTPTRAPFNYVNRAVSHGCMRVEKPMQLAEYFLNHNSKWTLDYLKIEIGQKVNNQTTIEEYKNKRSELRKNSSYGVTTEVKLDKYVPLFVDYYTVWVDKDGRLNYRDDVYGRDKKLKEQLFINY